MPNPIKYSTGSETNALKKGNFFIGTGDVGKGPSDVTGYYQGPSPASGGYVIYLNKEDAPGGLSYHSAANDSQLISFTNNLASTSFTSATQCLNYFTTQTDKVCFNRDYEGIVTNGLVLNVDAGFTPSYSRSGTTWYDVSGTNNGTLTNGPTFNSDNGGSIMFDYTNDYVNFNNLPTSTTYSVSCWFTTNTGNWNGALFGFGTGSSPDTQDVYLFGESSSGCASPSGGSFGFNTWNCDSWGFGNASSILKGTGFHHVVATFNHQNLTLNKLWLDGLEKTLTQQIGSTQFSANLKNQFKIAANGWFVGGQLWNGNIATCQVYNRILSDSEVLQNYNAQKGRFGL
jgi:hypothetical protein